jgi:hypothetical protein
LANESADAKPRQIVFQWGSNPGFKNLAFGELGRSLGVVLLTNGDDGLELADEILRAIDGNVHAFFRFPMLHPND